jgi:hypothetical protein
MSWAAAQAVRAVSRSLEQPLTLIALNTKPCSLPGATLSFTHPSVK